MMAPLIRRTWAPRGQTPILVVNKRSHEKVSGIGALVVPPRRRRITPFTPRRTYAAPKSSTSLASSAGTTLGICCSCGTGASPTAIKSFAPISPYTDTGIRSGPLATLPNSIRRSRSGAISSTDAWRTSLQTTPMRFLPRSAARLGVPDSVHTSSRASSGTPSCLFVFATDPPTAVSTGAARRPAVRPHPPRPGRRRSRRHRAGRSGGVTSPPDTPSSPALGSSGPSNTHAAAPAHWRTPCFRHRESPLVPYESRAQDSKRHADPTLELREYVARNRGEVALLMKRSAARGCGIRAVP